MKLKLASSFCDLLATFHSHGVRFLIVGGWAVSVDAQPRATKDMDRNFFANFISANDLIAAKVAAGRAQDLADVQAIREARQLIGKN